MKKRDLAIIIALSVGVLSVLIIFVVFPLVIKIGVCLHQKGITLELRDWEQDFKNIDSDKDAIFAIDVYEYIENYYTASLPSEGYYCSEKRSKQLELQRKETLETIIRSLEKYTGLQYGPDIKKWQEWATFRANENMRQQYKK